MKKNKIIILLFIIPFFLSHRVKQKKDTPKFILSNYSGTVSWTKTSTSIGRKTWDDNGKEESNRWNFHFEYKVTVNFKNGKGTMVREETDNKWDKDSLVFVHPENLYMLEERSKNRNCQGSDITELSVEFSDDRKYYWISFFTPSCTGTYASSIKNSIHGNTNNQYADEEPGGQITLPANFTGQPVNNNPDVLSGSFQETIPAPNDPGGGAIITTATWNLTKGSPKPELLVSLNSDDADYDNWMPEPGSNETTPGNQLNIQLHLQDMGGGPPDKKAKSFEITLVNTSKQPGTCLNAPLNPAPAKPDLRFLPQQGATLGQDGQSIKIPCDDGENGEVVLASFDGGGWTILNAKAILEDNSPVKGVLEQDQSKSDIAIPKNNTGGKIAQKWLDDNGNPGENADDETSSGNGNNGDGLSAYEEYRGFLSEGKFKRLDPQKKELGVKFKPGEKPDFAEGISKFENVTGLVVVPFYENETGPDRRLNKNAGFAHVVDQYVLFLQKGTLAPNFNGDATGGPSIPKNVSKIVIDFKNIHAAYLNDQSEASRLAIPLPYTEKDLLATVVAHELSHGVNVPHHGSSQPNSPNITIRPDQTNIRVFDHSGHQLTCPCHIIDRVGGYGSEQSGDLSCIMVPNSLCFWAIHETPDSTFFYEVPVIPLGTKLCADQAGTGINANNGYFGNAYFGKCIEKIRLK